MNLVGMSKAVNDLANRARNGQLKPDEIQGGTYTVTNVGTFGSIMGTPIINQPHVGILASRRNTKSPCGYRNCRRRLSLVSDTKCSYLIAMIIEW